MNYTKGIFKALPSLNFFLRKFSSKSKKTSVYASKPLNGYFLTNALGLSATKSAKILEENKKLLDVSRKDIIQTIEYLKSLKYTVEDIESKPMILYVNVITLNNRYESLQECGCNPITLSSLFKYITVMNKEVSQLKIYKIIPSNTDVQHELEKIFNSDIKIELNEKIDEQMPLRIFREKVLSAYLVEKFNLTQSQLEKQWKVYGRMRHKSFKSIIKMINILVEDLKFSLEKIIKNGYLVYGDPDNLKKIINEIPKIGSENIKNILYKRPKIIMSSFESIHNTIEHITKCGISEEAILKCIDILTLGSNTVSERLNDLKNIDELQALITNPRILRLVHYQNKALQRLEYLNDMKVKCVSLHLLSCDSDAFVRFVHEGIDKNKGKDVLVFLENVFNSSQNLLRKKLSKHSNWSHISVVQVKECIDFLLAKKFTLSDIFSNIHIILYPRHKIEEKLHILYSDEFYKENHLDTTYTYISYKQILTLCLYLMELEFHFTGDGVWIDQHTHSVENFNNLIPNFLGNNSRIYKFGINPNIESKTSI